MTDSSTVASATSLETCAPRVAHGVKCFPVIFATKRPALRDWQERATCDPDQLAALSREFPGQMNCGFLCEGVVGGVCALEFGLRGVEIPAVSKARANAPSPAHGGIKRPGRHFPYGRLGADAAAGGAARRPASDQSGRYESTAARGRGRPPTCAGSCASSVREGSPACTNSCCASWAICTVFTQGSSPCQEQ